VSKSFFEAFEKWKNDERYRIGEDCGTEELDNQSSDSTSDKRSLTQIEEDESARSA
jgi:hypothetical protein